VTQLANNGLRSQLDVTFVEVNLSQAKLLLLQAQEQEQQAYAQLTRTLGAQQNAVYVLAEELLPPGPPPDAEALVNQAVAARPELASLRMERDSAYRVERAERDLSYPTVSLVAVGGYIDYINQITLPRVIPNEYGGAAVNVHIPIFNGHLFSARREEAHYKALEAEQKLRDEEQAIARDVRTAWGGISTAYQRLDVTAQLLRQATSSRELAQGRYDNRLSSIVELTQAQLNETGAQIESLNAKYDYQSRYAFLQYTIGALR
jgi:outer membrane protein